MTVIPFRPYCVIQEQGIAEDVHFTGTLFQCTAFLLALYSQAWIITMHHLGWRIVPFNQIRRKP